MDTKLAGSKSRVRYWQVIAPIKEVVGTIIDLAEICESITEKYSDLLAAFESRPVAVTACPYSEKISEIWAIARTMARRPKLSISIVLVM